FSVRTVAEPPNISSILRGRPSAAVRNEQFRIYQITARRGRNGNTFSGLTMRSLLPKTSPRARMDKYILAENRRRASASKFAAQINLEPECSFFQTTRRNARAP